MAVTRNEDALSQKDRFDHLLRVISSQRFLKKQGLGNEVPFFICPYPPPEAVDMEGMRGRLVNQLANLGITVIEINLYDLAVSLLRHRGIWDEIVTMEPTVSKNELKELLQGVLDPETHLIPTIGERLGENEYDVFFVSGVGEAFPFIRSHNVLNNLQSTSGDKPTVMFFPGTYTHGLDTGASLDLFGLLHDDKYYRAFNIMHYEV